MLYQVIVGNIGVVTDTDSSAEAQVDFEDWVFDSKSGRGRAAGESVIMIQAGEIIDEYNPNNQDEE